MDYNENAESKQHRRRLMPSSVQSKHGPKDALKSLADAQRYLETLAKGADIPTTPADLAKAIEDFKATLLDNQAAANALVVAFLADEPCPVSLFKPWCSYAQARKWSMLPADKTPLPVEILNGKFCIRPSDFFAALKRHGTRR